MPTPPTEGTQFHKMFDTPIELVTRKDARVEMFVNQASTLGAQNAKIVFGRDVYYHLFNGPAVPENQIFRLRPAKPRELRMNGVSLCSDAREREAFDILFALSRKTFPEMVAGFRICLDTTREGEAFLLDELGRRSASRPVDYFRPHSSQTFRRRCSVLGFPFWRSSDDLLQPFYVYCTQC